MTSLIDGTAQQELTFNGYQAGAMRTWNVHTPRREQVANACMGLAGEVGEVIEPLKKHLYHGKGAPDVVALTKELGDVLYYLSVVAALFNVSLQDVADTNKAKLDARWPNGFRAGSIDTIDNHAEAYTSMGGRL